MSEPSAWPKMSKTIKKPHVKKYIRGKRLTFLELCAAIDRFEYVFDRDKPQHFAWMGSRPLFSLRQACHAGSIYAAILNPNYKEKPNVK
jgi:hypothetical protein